MQNVKAVRLPKRRRGGKEKSQRQLRAEKLAAYKKLLKHDVDWDYSSILSLFIFKLERTRNCIRSNNIIVEAPAVCAEIDQCVQLLKRVEADDYLHELLKPINKKYGKRDIYFEKIADSTSSRMLLRYAKKLTPRQIKAADAAHRQAYLQAEVMRADELRLAMTIMAECMTGWWD